MDHDPDSDDILFMDEGGADQPAEASKPAWRVLIVDDDEGVHIATTFAFKNTLVVGRPIEFFHAYTAAEAYALLPTIKDLAVVLLDVVMEAADSGLRLVKNIRDEFGMQDVRIILRTGQPGYAPEIDTIRDLDINDYKTKSELSRAKLYATLTAAIRSYDQISKINASRRGLDMIVRGSAALIRMHGLKEFASGVITQLAALLDLPPEGLVCAQESPDPDGYVVLAAAGEYERYINEPVVHLRKESVVEPLLQAIKERRNVFARGSSTFFIDGAGRSMAVYLEISGDLSEIDLKLIEVFCANIAVCFDNVDLFSRMRDQAYVDPLVQLPNRLHFLNEIDARLVRSGETDGVIAIIDVDSFAEVNEALGHVYGDMLLQSIARRLRDEFGRSVLVARVGGDVFGLYGSESAVKPEAILRLFSTPFDIGDERQIVSATVGLARLREVEGKAADVFKSAHIALKRAQTWHRGQYSFFNRSLGEETRDRINLLRNLRSAFESERLFMHYQPQVSLETGAVLGFEALTRWRTEDGQFVPPDAFIPLAERSGLILPLGEWILRTACHFQKRLHQDGYAGMRMAVNVSAVQFRSQGFLEMLDRALAETGVDPTLLELEITESVAMLDADFILAVIRQIKSRGIQLAVDDFGTGFSSLSYLHRLKVDRLKIDRSYIAQVTASNEGRSIARMVIELGRSLGLQVIAEGVEEHAQVTCLREMGCHEAQGYHFARPMDAGALAAWLAENVKRPG